MEKLLEAILPRIPEDKLGDFFASVSAHAEREAQKLAVEDPLANVQEPNHEVTDTAKAAINLFAEAVIGLLSCKFDKEEWMKYVEETLHNKQIRLHLLNSLAPIENALTNEAFTVYGTLTWAKAVGKEREAEQLIKAGYSSMEVFEHITESNGKS